MTRFWASRDSKAQLHLGNVTKIFEAGGAILSHLAKVYHGGTRSRPRGSTERVAFEPVQRLPYSLKLVLLETHLHAQPLSAPELTRSKEPAAKPVPLIRAFTGFITRKLEDSERKRRRDCTYVSQPRRLSRLLPAPSSPQYTSNFVGHELEIANSDCLMARQLNQSFHIIFADGTI